MNRRITVLGLGAVLIAAGLAGCTQTGVSSSGLGSSPSDAGTVGGGSSSSDGGNGNSAEGNSAGEASSGAAAAECKIAHLDVSIIAGDAGLGHRSKVIMFRNTGSTRCVLQGYPGVAALDAGGNQIEQAQRTLHGYLGGVSNSKPPLVNLAPGNSASATVEALASGPDGASCTGYAGLLVTPPDETHAVHLNWGSDGCSDLQIHPVVPGTTGQSS